MGSSPPNSMRQLNNFSDPMPLSITVIKCWRWKKISWCKHQIEMNDMWNLSIHFRQAWQVYCPASYGEASVQHWDIYGMTLLITYMMLMGFASYSGIRSLLYFFYSALASASFVEKTTAHISSVLTLAALYTAWRLDRNHEIYFRFL